MGEERPGMTEPAAGTPPPARPKRIGRIHWHVFLTHFPISLFGTAFAFQILHLFMESRCFEIATNVTLLAGTIMLLPTVLSGWAEWKTHFRAFRSPVFKKKISTASAMLALSLFLVVWRIYGRGLFEEAPESHVHWIYLAGNTGLILGAVVEGYYGGRLTHR
jgi:uncharacterized membrane protein